MHSNSELPRQVLQSRHLEVTGPPGWRDCIAVRTSADPADRTEQVVEREAASRNLNRNASAARDFRAALNRVDDKAYDACIDCEGPISPKRLEAPWAARGLF
jgi:RNA polymerase-binding transcription factor DksA